jgi:hypothetical protein
VEAAEAPVVSGAEEASGSGTTLATAGKAARCGTPLLSRCGLIKSSVFLPLAGRTHVSCVAVVFWLQRGGGRAAVEADEFGGRGDDGAGAAAADGAE